MTIVVGVDTSIHSDELVRVAGDERKAFNAATFGELAGSTFIQTVVSKTCAGMHNIFSIHYNILE